MRPRFAFTRLELLIVVIIIALLLSILVPSLLRARELSQRKKCAENVKVIGTGMYSASNDSADEWWRADWPTWEVYKKHQNLDIEYTQAIGSYRSRDLSESEITPQKLSCTRGLWLLVRQGFAPRECFICPSTHDIPNVESTPTSMFDFGAGLVGGPVSPDQASQFWHRVSYGFQVSFGKRGFPSSDRDPRMIALADKGPFGANIDAGLPAPPAFPAAGVPVDWQAWNSPNHAGQGQTVLYVDSHAEFITIPLSPSFSDNIYTRWAGETDKVLERSCGVPPAPGLKLMPASNTDSLIYP